MKTSKSHSEIIWHLTKVWIIYLESWGKVARLSNKKLPWERQSSTSPQRRNGLYDWLPREPYTRRYHKRNRPCLLDSPWIGQSPSRQCDHRSREEGYGHAWKRRKEWRNKTFFRHSMIWPIKKKSKPSMKEHCPKISKVFGLKFPKVGFTRKCF